MTKDEIAKTRRWFGLTLKEMGVKIGAHYTVVCEIERGTRAPTDSQARRINTLRARMLREMRTELHNG
jgi:predicted transcriptional regulator